MALDDVLPGDDPLVELLDDLTVELWEAELGAPPVLPDPPAPDPVVHYFASISWAMHVRLDGHRTIATGVCECGLTPEHWMRPR